MWSQDFTGKLYLSGVAVTGRLLSTKCQSESFKDKQNVWTFSDMDFLKGLW